jgi:hypothetical protein
MDQGNPSQHDEANFIYDAYGAGMDDDADGAFPMGGWDQHGPVVEEGYDVSGVEGYAPATTMNDFGTTQYAQGYQHSQPFQQDGQQYQEFMTQNMGDQQSNQEYDMNSMDLYHAPIYPNLAQDSMEYGIKPSLLY